MRYSKLSGDIKIYVVAGTQTVLLSFDIAKSKIDGFDFLGFSIERKDKKGKTILLNGSKVFQSLLPPHFTPQQLELARKKSLVQSFFWKDYYADPGETYTYTIRAMFGTAASFDELYSNTIKVSTEPLLSGKHSVFFNYGVTGSQGYAKNKEFGNKNLRSLTGAKLEKALNYLGRELWSEGLLAFVRQAKTKKHSLYCAFYEITYPGFLKELKLAKTRIKNLEIVYNKLAAQNKENTDPALDPGNIQSLTKFGLASVSHGRSKASQPHNKFMVLCENDKPIEVWTGSTNLSMSGIFGHCNTGHWIRDKDIAEKYKKYWDLLKDNPKMKDLADVSESIQADTDLSKLKKGTYLFFSPRDLPHENKTTPAHLQAYANLINKAKELVCMIIPFNYDPVFKNIYDKDKNYLRLLLFEKPTQAKLAKSNDVDLKVTGGAILNEPLEQWVGEVSAATSAGSRNVFYVHNKFFIIDPLGNEPVVLSGSANFSINSIVGNDENSVLIKGDQRVADIYLTEFNRLFEHFWPRYLRAILHNNNEGFGKPLDENYEWYVEYHDPKTYGFKRKQLFINMKGAMKG